MKKLLALVLALVMVMGLATVGTSAATEYSDKADINYDEAVAVMSSIGVLEGADGKFRPAAELKRSEAAKIVAYLYYNNKTAAGLIGVGKFSDVPTNHWAAGYVDTLANAGVIAGRGNGAFDPDGDLKAIDFAKMLLVCVGYNAKIEGLVGSDYAINTSKLAAQAGLFAGLNDLKANDTLTREQAAQMAFNAVKAATVEYANKGGEISLNGATVSIGSSNFNYVTTTIAKDATNIDDRVLTNAGINNTNTGYTIEFGERQYPDLKCIKTTDDFGRPANEWINGKETIGKYVDKANLLGSFTTYVTGADLFNLIGEAKIKNTKDSELHYFVNGREFTYITPDQYNNTHVDRDGKTIPATDFYRLGGVDRSNMIRSNKTPYAFTGNGVLTEVYEKNDELYVVSIMTYWAKADGDYNAKKSELAIKDVSCVANTGIAPSFTTYKTKISSDDVKFVVDCKDKDPLLVRYAWNGSTYEVVEAEAAKKEAAQTVTKYSTNEEKLGATKYFYNGYAVAAGAQKVYSKCVGLDELMQTYSQTQKALDTTYDLYYDSYGYVIKADPVDTKVNYVFIAGLDGGTSNLGLKTADAFGIFADGTSANIKVNLQKSNEYIKEYNRVLTTGGAITKIDGVVRGGANGTTPKQWLNSDGKWNYTITNNCLYYKQFGRDTDNTTVTDDGDYAYNRWFYYTTEGEGANAVYTLTPVAQSLMVHEIEAGNKNKHSTVNGQELININTKAPAIVGTAQTYADAAGTARLTGWGNEKTTYITVKTAPTSGTANANILTNGYTRGISEVSGVFTGLQSVDITAYQTTENRASDDEDDLKETNPFDENVWAVFNKDNYIVSAVIVGDDGGNSGNYIYAISKGKSEWKEGSYYYWNFDAIVDGQEKELTVKTKYTNTLAALEAAMKFNQSANEGALFNVTFDKDGYVTSWTQVDWNASRNNDKVYGNAKVAGGQNANTEGAPFDKEKVYNVYFHNNDTLSYAANTIWNKLEGTNAAANKTEYVGDSGSASFTKDRGLSIANGAPIYVIQEHYSKNSSATSAQVEQFTSLDRALGAIVTSNGGEQKATRPTVTFNGYISAALDSNCQAKWVVIKQVVYDVWDEDNKAAGGAQTTVTVSDYNNATGFTLTLANFATKSDTIDVAIEVWERQAGDDEYIKINTTGNNVDFDADGNASIVVKAGGNGNNEANFTYTAGARYYFVINGLKTDVKKAQ